MIGANRRAMAAALALAALSAGCSEPPPPQMYLPAADDLPYDINQDCGCVRDGACAMLEQVAGHREVRNVECRWGRPNKVALCRYEERFVAWDSGPGNSIVNRPGPWAAKQLRATLLPDGRWCSEP